MKKTSLKFLIFLFLILALLFCCAPKEPTAVDGTLQASFVLYDTSGVLTPGDSTLEIVPVANATVTFSSENYARKYSFQTDENGRVDISGLIYSSYRIDFRYTLPNKTSLIAEREMDITDIQTVTDTVFMKPKPPTPITINEIYTAGPQNNQFFFYDLYIELFNPTDTTGYLDGMILTRVRGSADNRPYIEIWDYVQNLYAFKFPGLPGEKNHPIEPGEYIVIAADAYNHTLTNANAVNLENADYEFYNQNSNDFDNPNVTNLENLIPTHRTEFLLGLNSDEVVLGDGKNWQLVDITTSTGSSKTVLHIPIANIVDGVEYAPNPDSQKDLTKRVDSGIAGEGLTKYSGKSIERINPYQDTNNSTFDFVIISPPTPGYFH